jgi:hypothetical protein
VITRNGKKKNGVHILDGMPQTLAHGAEEGATKVAEAVEIAGAKVAKGAGHASGAASELSGQLKGQAGHLKGQASELSGQLKGQANELSGQLKGQANELSGQLKGRAAQAPLDLSEAKRTVRDAGLSMRKARLGARESVTRTLSRSLVKRRRTRLLPSPDAMLKAQLARTTRELAHESSDLNAAVDSLNQIIKSNRRDAAKGRTRLLGGAALGVIVMYHLDSAQGRQRRAATGRMLTGMIRGQHRAGGPPGAV